MHNHNTAVSLYVSRKKKSKKCGAQIPRQLALVMCWASWMVVHFSHRDTRISSWRYQFSFQHSLLVLSSQTLKTYMFQCSLFPLCTSAAIKKTDADHPQATCRELELTLMQHVATTVRLVALSQQHTTQPLANAHSLYAVKVPNKLLQCQYRSFDAVAGFRSYPAFISRNHCFMSLWSLEPFRTVHFFFLCLGLHSTCVCSCVSPWNCPLQWAVLLQCRALQNS